MFSQNRDQIGRLTYDFLEGLPAINSLIQNPDSFNHTAFGFIDLTKNAVHNGQIYWPLMIIAVVGALTQYIMSKQIMPKTDGSKRRLRDLMADAAEGKEHDQAEMSQIVSNNMIKFMPVMMFFIFCFVGWVWEVSLAFISEGTFVNRGTLHGPWLPIYGTGGVIILILLKKLRKKPLFEFLAAMVLCGGLEYFSSWYLEKTHGGQRWWDYTGYFLNLNGRICAEGLLTFGLGGLAIVYLLAPAWDNLLSRIDTRKLTVVAVVLLAFYCVDQAYSAQHPNIGAGITDYKGSATSQVS